MLAILMKIYSKELLHYMMLNPIHYYTDISKLVYLQSMDYLYILIKIILLVTGSQDLFSLFK